MKAAPDWRATLPKGDAGTDATVAAMRAVVHHAMESPRVLALAKRLDIRGRHPRFAASVLFALAKRHVVFSRDPFGKELLMHPDQLLQEVEETGITRGDCDDLAMLIASVLAAGGHSPVFVVMGRHVAMDFEHVYAGVKVDGGYLAIDPQECARPGEEVPGARRKVYQV